MQFLRPIEQIETTALWGDQTGSNSAMHLAIDEVVLDTADYAQCFGSGIGGDTTEWFFWVRLSSSQTPVEATNHTIKIQARRLGSAQVSLGVDLTKLNNSPIRSQVIVLTSESSLLYTVSLTPSEIALCSGQYDAGSGLSNMKVKFRRIGDPAFPGDASAGVRIEQAYFEVPDPGFEHLDISSGYGLKIAAVSSGNYLEVPSGFGFKRVAGGEGATALINSSGIGVKVHG